jgi:hypothetical protein
MQFIFIFRLIQDEGLYMYNMHNIVEKHFSISIARFLKRVKCVSAEVCLSGVV